MKKHITRKGIEKRVEKVLNVPYCDLQNLLKFESVIFYNSGIYGWNWDGYLLNGTGDSVAIVTGYRNFISNGIDVKHDVCKKYDNLALKILEKNHNYNSYTIKKMNMLLNKFIKEVLNND